METSANKYNLVIKREQIIVKTSIIGIITNVILASFKVIVGLFAN